MAQPAPPQIMILDHIQNHGFHTGVHPLFPSAFAHLLDLAARRDLPDGRLDLDGDRIHAIVVHGVGKAREDARLETHRRHIDIQFTKDGSDLIGWMPLTQCQHPQGYDGDKDVEFYSDTAPAWIDVGAGQFAVFFPSDAHAPMAQTNQPVTKIVIKVAV